MRHDGLGPNDRVVLDITWDEGKDLPRFVGPFVTDEEAAEWARLNVTRGSTWVSAPLAYPYLTKLGGVL